MGLFFPDPPDYTKTAKAGSTRSCGILDYLFVPPADYGSGCKERPRCSLLEILFTTRPQWATDKQAIEEEPHGVE